MDYLTRDILSFYKTNENNLTYLERYFTDTSHLGRNTPYATDVISREWNKISPNIRTIDEYNTYEINSWGLRGEVYENASILGTGCSITFGIGVPELATWTKLLGDLTNEKIMNLGNPGASIETICIDLIRYCMNNKMPEKIFCLMPDFFRSQVVVDKEFYKSHKETAQNSLEIPEVLPNHLELRYCNPIIDLYKDSILMQIKDQKYIEDATSPHQLILDCINYLYILESFCLTNNIKLYWTTWDLSSFLIMEQLTNLKDFKLKNYIPFYPTGNKKHIGGYIESTCDQDHGSKFKDDVAWYRGTDYSVVHNRKTGDNSHPGIHCQQHIAEFFYNLSFVK